MTLKQWLLLQNLLAQSSENVDAQNTQTEETDGENEVTSTVNEGAKTFTQDEVNKLIAKEKNKVKNQFKDYPDLRETLAKAQEELKSIKEANKSLANKFTETVYTTILESVAKEMNLDPELASKLIDKEKVIFVDDKPSNLKELIQATIEKHPNLVKKQVVTPIIETPKPNEQKYSLHKQPKSNFFQGSGLRTHFPKDS